mmetsp:Transcript_21555/g.66458  ORF Transcript_21555/g.66458 Transcript_21555/m.66458 type:complete len:207 (-) Transcript_21555:170-790(-)
MLAAAFGRYEAALCRYPVPTKMASGAVLWGLGDAVAQAGSAQQREFDGARLGRAVVYGTVIHAPIAHCHYEFLEAFVQRTGFSAATAPLAKLVMEQFVYWGWVSNALYHFSMAKMEGYSVNDSAQRVSDRLWATMKSQWAFWIPVQYLNFKFVPVRHQLGVVLTTSVAWCAFLSLTFSDVPVPPPSSSSSSLAKEEERPAAVPVST